MPKPPNFKLFDPVVEAAFGPSLATSYGSEKSTQGRDIMKTALVADLMMRDVSVVRSDADVHELEKLLLREKIHGVPVVDEQERLVGVVSQTDLLAWHYASGVDGANYYSSHDRAVLGERPRGSLRVSDIRTASVEEVMSPVVHCICPDQPIALAAARMTTRLVHRLVVVDEAGRVLGIISAVDLLHCVPGAEDWMEEAKREKTIYTNPSDQLNV